MRKRHLHGLYASAMFLCLSATASQAPLPIVVHRVAEDAEGIIDYYQKEDWQGAQALADSIGLQAQEIHTLMLENKMPSSSADLLRFLFFRLRALNESKSNALEAALVANQITDQLIDLQGHYEHTTPLGIARMDYLGREVVLLTQLPNAYGLLDERISQLGAVWSDLEPVIRKRKNGEGVADQVSKVVAGLRRAGPRQQKIADGRRILDLVDELEALFR
jgi:hypothetical protein